MKCGEILKYFFVAFFLLAQLKVLGQKNIIQYDKYFFEQGLSQAQINCIAQDSIGYIWFGTQDGLNRFDGYDFKVYRNDPENQSSISSNFIRSIYVDETNDIWVTTHGGGLNKLDKYRNKFKRFLINNRLANSFNQNILTAVYPGDKDNLLIGTEGFGLYIFNKKYSRFSKIEPFGSDSKIISKIIKLNDRFFLIGTGNGVVIFDWDLKKIVERKNKLIDKQFIESVCKLSDGTILIGTLSGMIYQIGSSDNYMSEIHVIEKFKEGSSVWTILEDKNKSIWLGTESELILLPFDRSKTSKISARLESLSTKYPYRTKCLYKDASGLLWIGTVNSGIIKAKIKPDFFEKITFAKENGLQDNSAWYVCKDNTGSVWIGTDGYGLIRYDRAQNHFDRWTYQPGNGKSLSSNLISYVLNDSKKNVWVSTFGGGINLLMKDNTFYHLMKDPKNPSSLIHDYVWCMLEDYKGSIWVGTKKGIDELNIVNKTFTHHQHNPLDTNSLSNDLVFTLFEDSNKNIWVGTFGGGLNKFDRKTEKFTVYKSNPKDQETVSNNSIMSIAEDSKGYLWIGTDTGLNRLDIQSNKFTRYFVKDGLANDMIYGVAIDENDFVWVSTNRGISAFDQKRKTFSNFNMSDGLLSEEFNQSASFRAADGEIFFAGINGINSFYPKYLYLNKREPKVAINKIMLFNQEIPREKYLDGNSLEVYYDQNYLQFEFSALEFTNPEKNTYKYKLEGFNQEWIYSGSRRVAIFSNLDPGNYTLKIMAANNNGVWNNKGISFGLIVLPPFWQTWWFRILAFAVLALSLYMIYRIRVARLLEIERLRLQIASDLHDEVGSALTSIAIQTQLLNKEVEKEELESRTGFIGGLARDVIGAMSDIIWSIDSRNDSLEDLVERMQNFSFNLFNDSSIEINYQFTLENPRKKIQPYLRQNIYMIFKEAANNIYKHSGATTASIKLVESANKIEMIISDNGKGVDASNVYAGNGLKNIKMRAERIKAKLNFVSEEGFTLRLLAKIE